MKKIIISILLLIAFMGTVGKLIKDNYSDFKDYYQLYNKKKELTNKNVLLNQQVKQAKNLLKNYKNENKVDQKVRNFCNKRYLFKYDDFMGLRIVYIKRIQDIKTGKFLYELKLQYTVQKSGTMFSILNILYKDPNIEKINLIDRKNLIIYLNEKKILLKIKG